MAQEVTTQDTTDIARPNGETAPTVPTFVPAVDIFEQGEITVILADMPGVKSDGIEVTLERQVLTLRGTVTPHEPEGYRRLSSEYREGDYLRAFTLSDEIDLGSINAAFKNGVLRLELPRAAEAKPKKITVKAA
ncbi:Hsp20/alpha crystallin family protein [Yoonia sediminilitoris]|uniref:HSP20 family molecular chaperone IbpA n=1 Tax=Yoonia sediminilitoris TaxID=1286148 RepID=A0A2T6KC04_9RHOB|nr:Hsp20/alpha crystallin family protein [Yoonia sediminilitoris]PUB12434.1 HSP20 family molecular chaperone IbpA [Yoonia sediminilitoris]RCW93128.1 HSP20 family molecular chaperone IbpA [Yoonia sediminilitoris]